MSLNDPQWGRGGGSNSSNDGDRDGERRPPKPGNDGPPDLDELWRDFNRRLNNMFGRRGGGGRPSGGGLGSFRPNGNMSRDMTLFQDDDGKVYFVYQDGKIARMKDDMTGLAETPRLLKPANFQHVGFEGAFLTKIKGRYQLVCAEFNQRDGINAYDCMVASAENVYGPYGDRYLALPSAGHNMVFRDKQGQWWATFFGNDPQAPWRERPGILPIQLDASGRIVPGTNQTQP